MFNQTFAENLSDPTRPVKFFAEVIEDVIPEQLLDWSVKAIRITPDTRTAVINNTIVKVGDTVGQAEVLEIRPLSVLLDYDRQQVEVKLVKHGIKKILVNDQ